MPKYTKTLWIVEDMCVKGGVHYYASGTRERARAVVKDLRGFDAENYKQTIYKVTAMEKVR